jgi:hypothetical protein
MGREMARVLVALIAGADVDNVVLDTRLVPRASG